MQKIKKPTPNKNKAKTVKKEHPSTTDEKVVYKKKEKNLPKIKPVQLNDKTRAGENKIYNISAKTKKLLNAYKIDIWQACLRENITLTELKEVKGISIEIPNHSENHPNTPIYAPTWAGGKGKRPLTNSHNWSKSEEKDFKKNSRENPQTMYVWEQAILLGQWGGKVAKKAIELDIKPQAHPTWVPKWAKYSMDKEPDTSKDILNINNQIKSTNKPLFLSEQETINLEHYWKLELLGTQEIAGMLEKTHDEILKEAENLGLPTKSHITDKNWGGTSWRFEEDTPSDPKLLDSTTQSLVAETSATRFSLLYETLEHIKESDAKYKKIQKELSRIVELHHRIFSKYLSVKSRKYNYQGTSQWLVQDDLEQAGKTAIFDCLRRWHPNRKIRFSRGAVCIAITREMIAWVEQQRLVELPDKIRAVARKLKHAQESGNLEQEYNRLKAESGEKCVREAAKHQNTYAYISTVPLMDSHDEKTKEEGGVATTSAECLGNYSSFSTPVENTDISTLIISSTQKLSEEEKRAVLSYHGINEDGTHTTPKTLEEIGEEEGVTKERIRQRITKAKARMKRWMEAKNIKSVTDIYAMT